MIPAAPSAWQPDDWRQILKCAIRDGDELLRHLAVKRTDVLAAPGFGVLVPYTFLQRMERGNPADPLLRQVLATSEELINPADFVEDPLSENACSPMPGVLHKYAGRALLTLTSACPIHCRYCFRRHFPYPGALDEVWRKGLNYVRADPSISEVILSGGDPLTLSDEQLHTLMNDIGSIGHVRRIRIHTRFPIVIPQRVTDALVALLSGRHPRPVVVVHTNHPHELDADVARALGALHAGGCHLLNQSVLLAGVNADAAVLAELSERLFDLHVLPYYLHLLDRVHGAAHFDVPQSRARQIHRELKRRLPGYLVPRMVREEPGGEAKKELMGSF